jgi:hypothetical protein
MFRTASSACSALSMPENDAHQANVERLLHDPLRLFPAVGSKAREYRHVRLGVALLENGRFVDHADRELLQPRKIHRPVLHLHIHVVDIGAGQSAGVLKR